MRAETVSQEHAVRFAPLEGEGVANADVYGHFRRAILHARFLPGQLISLRALAGEFGISTMPLREAASRLVADGALEAISRRGFRVPTIDATTAMQIINLRVELEGRAAAAAAKQVSPAQIAELEAIEIRLEESVAAGEMAAVLALNTDFHLCIYRAANDPILLQLIETLLLRYAPNLAATMAQLPAGQTDALFDQTHTMMIAALKDNDPVRARRAVEDDITQAAELCWGIRTFRT